MSSYEVKMQKLPEQENRMITLMREKDVYEKIFTLLLDKREEIRVAELSKLQDIVIIDQPQEPIESIRPRKLLNMLIALSLGGFIGIVFVFLIELRNTKLINLDDLEEEFNLPILAIIPNYDKDIVKRINNSADNKDRFVTLMGDNVGIRESYRLLKIKLFYHLDGIEKIFLVTSCEENTGKTSIVANLAITMAKENKKVLIIDCDLRKAELSKMFDVSPNAPGLIGYLTRGGPPAIYTRIMKKIDIMPAGGVREDSSSLLSSDRMKSLFTTIDTSSYDYIIIDTPPVTRVVDTLVLGQFVENAILVVRPDTSMKETVIGGIQEMNQAKIKIRGVVANAAEIHKSYYYRYRYGYGYGYSYGENGKKTTKRKINTVQAAV
jgi:capsular exopolysaccharide synthesis family protein